MPESLITINAWANRPGHHQLSAACDIAAGTPVVRETPLVRVGLGPYRYGTFAWALVDALLRDPPLRAQYLRWNLASAAFSVRHPDDVAAERAISRARNLPRKSVRALFDSVATNNIACLNSLRGVQGYGLYRVLSRSNHSCIPNARLDPGDTTTGEMVLVALRDIPAGTPLTWSYLEPAPGAPALAELDFMTRQWHIFNEYQFACVCELCRTDMPEELRGCDMATVLLDKIERQTRALKGFL